MTLLTALVLAALPTEWTTLAAGIEARSFELVKKPQHGDGLLAVVRIDPRVATLEFALAAQHHERLRTAGEWADEKHLVVAINAGMYEKDFRSNVGYLRNGAFLNQKSWKPTYQSVFAFGPTEKGLPAAQLFDRELPDLEGRVAKYSAVVQNLRLVKGPPATNVWSSNKKQWSEALVAQDDAGRVLFMFSRTPFEMADLVARVLALPLGVVRAMHVEGGPEASLSIRAKGLSVDYAGSFETNFLANDSNAKQWPIPNIIGAR
jgi:Phosphodiester glycosidase